MKSPYSMNITLKWPYSFETVYLIYCDIVLPTVATRKSNISKTNEMEGGKRINDRPWVYFASVIFATQIVSNHKNIVCSSAKNCLEQYYLERKMVNVS